MPYKDSERAKAYSRQYAKNKYMLNRDEIIMKSKERRIALRIAVNKFMGNKCEICKTTEHLQLHHRYYASDSIRPKVHNENGSQTIKRMKEALKYPQRFRLLCLSCHNSIEPKRKKKIPLAIWFDRQELVK